MSDVIVSDHGTLHVAGGGVLEVSRAVKVVNYPAEDIQHPIVVSGSRSEFRATGLDVALQNLFTDINQGGQSSLRIDGKGSVVELLSGYLIARLREPTRTDTAP